MLLSCGMLEVTIEILDALVSFSIIPAHTVLVRTARHGTDEGVPGIDHHSLGSRNGEARLVG